MKNRLIEMNEAFAAQVLANVSVWVSIIAQDELGRQQALGEVDPQKLNVNGGGALGHLGMTGTRITITLLKRCLGNHCKR